MYYEPSFKLHLCVCSSCGYQFEILNGACYQDVCDECYTEQVERDEAIAYEELPEEL